MVRIPGTRARSEAELQYLDDLSEGRRAGELRSTWACREKLWHLRLWNDSTGEELRVPYRCRSWRHEGECAWSRGAQDYSRILKAMEPYPMEYISFWVLTFDRRRFSNQWFAYKYLCRCWQTLSQSLRRAFGPLSYAAVAEQHQRGWPHINILIVSPGIGQYLAANWKRNLRKGEHRMSMYNKAAKDHLIARACRAGFGNRMSAELIRSKGGLADYVVKLSSVSKIIGEVSKLTQVPLAAPKGFRRLRSSRGFLPPLLTAEEWSGELVQAPMPPMEVPNPTHLDWLPGAASVDDDGAVKVVVDRARQLKLV